MLFSNDENVQNYLGLILKPYLAYKRVCPRRDLPCRYSLQ